ncbi:MAG: contractile injection system tape measure protein [Verrucomicrobia bacterium]|nr:contractile injection system tape measure protein [Verrucomicrobiota bacterium]MDA1069671.1 contractile injection system tape measure protein [Verrucomicrobiota bacterium]
MNALDVDFAGVVLLHPFLPVYFERLGLWQSGGFADSAAHERAVHLAAHLATGRDRHDEPELALAKVLCGWPLARPVATPRGTEKPSEERLKALAEFLRGGGGGSK